MFMLTSGQFNHRGDVVSRSGPSYSFIFMVQEFDKVKALALAKKVERAAFVVTVSSFGRVNFIGGALQQWSKSMWSIVAWTMDFWISHYIGTS